MKKEEECNGCPNRKHCQTRKNCPYLASNRYICHALWTVNGGAVG